MKILIVEDEKSKMTQIINVLKGTIVHEIHISKCESLLSSIKNIAFNPTYDLAILDMSMPNYDISADEPSGGLSESFAGRELMYQMKLRKKLCPIIVVTQYRSFEKGLIELDDLDREFKNEFNGYYLGYVYYNAAVDGWTEKLKDIVLSHLEN
ncbi:response regulator [Providencia rettgeri]|nr:response regulator [Providencia rettgeri]